ncbi:MAG: hypothetical protein IPP17_24120 [Bacteroidetes bacterium]|nr:hypothetical protein [Bacteroidota bacterium]
MNFNSAKNSFYYGSNKRNPQAMDLYKMSSADWKPQLIFQNDDALEVADLSMDEKMVSLARPVTTSENELYIREIASRKMTAIHDSTAPGNYLGSGFNKDASHFYYLTNAKSEFTVLMDYEIATGTHRKLYEAKWDVQYSYLSETEKYRVIAINEDGKK